MTERLDRIEALLDRTAEQTANNRGEIEDLAGLFRNTLEAFERTQQEIAESNRRFDILRDDAIADRQRSDERFEESNRRFQAMQEDIQRLYLEVRSTNVSVAGLSDRVSSLEDEQRAG